MQAKSKGLYILHKRMPNVAEKLDVKRVLVKPRRRWAKGKIYCFALHFIQAYGRDRSTASLIFNLFSRWWWVVSLSFRPLQPQGKSPSYLPNRRPGKLQNIQDVSVTTVNI